MAEPNKKSTSKKWIVRTILIGLAVMALYGVIVGAIGATLRDSDPILETPEVHLPAGAVFPEEKREESARGENLGIMGFAITNTMLSSFITTIILASILIIGASKKSLVPGRFQALVETIIEALLNFVEGVAGKRFGRAFFPVIATVFLFVMLNAWMGLLPFYPALGFHPEHHDVEESGVVESYDGARLVLEGGHTFLIDKEHTVFEDHAEPHVGEEIEVAGEKTDQKDVYEASIVSHHLPGKIDLLRPAGTDLNMPLALAIVSFLFVEFWGLRSLGFGYLGKFFRFGWILKGPKHYLSGGIDAFVGILEGISEVVRLLSFTFRLFGNMLAGEILILVATFLFPFVVPSLFFYELELLVGVIQAMIFAGLTVTFATLAVAHHGDEH
ncbi:MAG: F0F1 ATP synthase subunit A [SAR202 cluster bacterium]|nr:F0F1 ATP synthase subunit A [SAR202 cluster bacterium]